MRAADAGPRQEQVKPKTVPLDLFVGYPAGGGASRLPVSLRIGWFDTVPAPQGYDAYSFGGDKVTEGVKPLNPNGEETASPLPPTQTIPLTLGADGPARSAVDVPTSLAGPASMRELGRAAGREREGQDVKIS